MEQSNISVTGRTTSLPSSLERNTEALFEDLTIYEYKHGDDAPSRPLYAPLDLSHKDGVATRLVKVLPDLSPEGRIQCTIDSVFLPLVPITMNEIDEQYIDRTNRDDIHVVNEGLRVTVQKYKKYIVEHQGMASHHLEYNAVSYLWGEDTTFDHISSAGVLFPAGYNLWNFLDRIRQIPSWTSEYWWIDALSIDQSNIPEKSYQVERMGLIYCYASSIVTWLSTCSEQIERLLDILIDVQKVYDDIPYKGMHLKEHFDVLQQCLQKYNWSSRDC